MWGLVFYPMLLSTCVYTLWREFTPLWNAWAVLIELVRGQLARGFLQWCLLASPQRWAAPWACASLPTGLSSVPSQTSLLDFTACPTAKPSICHQHLKKTNTYIVILPALWTGNASGTCAGDSGVCTYWRVKQVEPDTLCWSHRVWDQSCQCQLRLVLGLLVSWALSFTQMPFSQRNDLLF